MQSFLIQFCVHHHRNHSTCANGDARVQS